MPTDHETGRRLKGAIARRIAGPDDAIPNPKSKIRNRKISPELERLLAAGAALSNMAFNLKQNEQPPDAKGWADWRVRLEQTQKRWDAAFSEWRAA